MSLESRLEQALKDESDKLIQRHHAYHNAVELEYRRKLKRTSSVSPKIVSVPETWTVNNRFNPFYVKKRRAGISRSIARKIQAGIYRPNPPYYQLIPKATGGSRRVTIYEIPDAAVSKLIYEQLLSKNRHRFSSYSYAYRNDRNVHFAIQDIGTELATKSRVFVAEFDFSGFFDSIDHEYLFCQLSKNSFSVSRREEQVLRAFLEDRKVGVPQGTSISLFLANLVCWQLDKQLERLGLGFARYADDIVIWASSYQRISQAFDAISDFSKDSGIPINPKKSDGISLLCSQEMPAEIANRKDEIEFLGYAISVNSISIKKSSVNKIKKQIGYILHKHLIQPLQGTSLHALSIPSNNRDRHLVSAMMEIRRYLYGNLTDEMIWNYLDGTSNRIFFKGMMSFYPLINDERQLKSLDGWLVTSIHKALKRRSSLLKSWGYNRSYMFPFNVSRGSLVASFSRTNINGRPLLRVPSFYAMYRALKKGVADVGVEGVINPSSCTYNY